MDPGRGDARVRHAIAAGRSTQDWRARTTSALDAVSSIRPGDRVFVGTARATPRTLVDALEQLDKPPAGVVLTHFLTDRVGSGETRYRHRVFYVGRDIRGLRASTRLECLPLSLAAVPALLRLDTGGTLFFDHADPRWVTRLNSVRVD